VIAGYPVHRVDQVGAADLLEHVPGCPRHDRGEQCLVVVVGGQDQARDGGQGGPDLPADLDAAAVGQPGVQHGDIRLHGGDAAQRLAGPASLTHHLDIAVLLQQIPQPAPDHLVIVEQEHPQHRAGGALLFLAHPLIVLLHRG
jgi:hypothetical protein